MLVVASVDAMWQGTNTLQHRFTVRAVYRCMQELNFALVCMSRLAVFSATARFQPLINAVHNNLKNIELIVVTCLLELYRLHMMYGPLR